jgi:hypothetical protein
LTTENENGMNKKEKKQSCRRYSSLVCLDVREQGSGLHVLFVEVAFDQTQAPYLTGRGGVVSGVCGNVLAVCGLESVDTGSLLGVSVRKAPLVSGSGAIGYLFAVV